MDHRLCKRHAYVLFEVILLLVFGIIYSLDNSVNRASSSITSQYLLSVNPSTLGSGGSAQILLSSVQTKIVPKNINILVINPKGAEYTPSHIQKKCNRIHHIIHFNGSIDTFLEVTLNTPTYTYAYKKTY
jgi:hypothetical protein